MGRRRRETIAGCRWRVIGALFVACVGLSVCGGCAARRFGWDDEPSPENVREARARAVTVSAQPDLAALRQEEARAWARRDEPEQLERAIALQQRLLEARGGTDRSLLVKLSRAHHLLGMEREQREARIGAFAEGMRYGDLALYTFARFREEIERGQPPHEAVQVLGKEAVGAIYWDAVNMAKWARAKGMLKVLTLKDKARAMIERVRVLDPRYYHGAADRYLGAYYAALPGFAGRDLDRAREHFDRALQIGPDYLFTRVLMAEYLAVALDDRAMYERLLREVLAADPSRPPGIAPEQRLAQKRAAAMLASIDDLFDEPEAADSRETTQERGE